MVFTFRKRILGIKNGREGEESFVARRLGMLGVREASPTQVRIRGYFSKGSRVRQGKKNTGMKRSSSASSGACLSCSAGALLRSRGRFGPPGLHAPGCASASSSCVLFVIAAQREACPNGQTSELLNFQLYVLSAVAGSKPA